MKRLQRTRKAARWCSAGTKVVRGRTPPFNPLREYHGKRVAELPHTLTFDYEVGRYISIEPIAGGGFPNLSRVGHL